MAEIRSSLGREQSRSVRLRAVAELVDEQADRAPSPLGARALARELRLRATELEIGADARDRDDAQDEFAALIEGEP